MLLDRLLVRWPDRLSSTNINYGLESELGRFKDFYRVPLALCDFTFSIIPIPVIVAFLGALLLHLYLLGFPAERFLPMHLLGCLTGCFVVCKASKVLQMSTANGRVKSVKFWTSPLSHPSVAYVALHMVL